MVNHQRADMAGNQTITDQIISSIDVGPNPNGLAISPDGRKLLVVAFGANQAMVIDTTSGRIFGQMPVPLAHNGAVSTNGRMASVGSQQQGATAIAVLDLTDMQEIAKVPLDKTPRGLDLRRCLKTCHVRQTMYHQPDHGDADHGFAGLRQVLIILRQAAVPAQPREGPLDYPAFRQEEEAVSPL